MYRNSKHYPDPTAGAALAHITHEKYRQQKHNDCKKQSTDDAKAREQEPCQRAIPVGQSASRSHPKTKWKNVECNTAAVSRCICTGDKPFQNLAIAVIRQAVYDYLALGRRLQICKCRDDMREIENKMKALSRFFLGCWYSTLSGNIDGGMILEALDQEVFGDD